jgi:arylsulfatase A-like enzyme
MPVTDKNVLLIVLDDIGVEWFEMYGIGRKYTTDPNFEYCKTPNLNALAADGVLFHEAYANPICGPTRACIQTGKYAFRTGFGTNIRDPQTNPIPPDKIGDALSSEFTWLPEAIEAGRPGVYDKAAIGKWHLCDGYSTVVATNPPPAPDAFLEQAGENGYEHSAIHIPNYGCAYSWFRVVDGAIDPPGGFIAPPFKTQNWLASVVADDALQWINSRTKPWFLYLCFNPPHAPFVVPPFETLSGTTQRQLAAMGYAPGDAVDPREGFDKIQPVFRAAMESVDFCIGQLLASLAHPVLARTMIIVTGDNGTVRAALPPGFLHAKREVFRGGTQVPFIVKGPLVVDPGRTTNAMAHSVDLYATVLDIVGAPVPTIGDGFDSVSLMPVIRNSGAPRARIFTETFRPFGEMTVEQQTSVSRALYDGRWRYVFTPQSGGSPGQLDAATLSISEQLFDDPNDPLEQFNVIDAEPEIAAALREELDALIHS